MGSAARLFSIVAFLGFLGILGACGKSTDSQTGNSTDAVSNLGSATGSTTASGGSGDLSSLFNGSGGQSGSSSTATDSAADGAQAASSALASMPTGSPAGAAAVQQAILAFTAYINAVKGMKSASSASVIRSLIARLNQAKQDLKNASNAAKNAGENEIAKRLAEIANRVEVWDLWRPELPRIIQVVDANDIVLLTNLNFKVMGVGFQVYKDASTVESPQMLYLCALVFTGTATPPLFFVDNDTSCSGSGAVVIRNLGYGSTKSTGNTPNELLRTFNAQKLDSITLNDKYWQGVVGAYGYAPNESLGYVP